MTLDHHLWHVNPWVQYRYAKVTPSTSQCCAKARTPVHIRPRYRQILLCGSSSSNHPGSDVAPVPLQTDRPAASDHVYTTPDSGVKGNAVPWTGQAGVTAAKCSGKPACAISSGAGSVPAAEAAQEAAAATNDQAADDAFSGKLSLDGSDIVPTHQAASAAVAAPLRRRRIRWPPTEASAAVGLAVAVAFTQLTNTLLCKPVLVHHCQHRVIQQCSSCCAPPAAQAHQHQYIQRCPQHALSPLPLPLARDMHQDQLLTPTYHVPSLVSVPAPLDDDWTSALIAVKEWVHGRVAYHFQQVATAHVSQKVLALWLFAFPFILVFGYVYKQVAQVTMKEAMYKVYALLYRVPGVGIAKEANTASYLVANTVFLAGMFTFAAIIGIVSDEIKTGIKNSRTGNYNMRLSGHILLLNWSSSSTALLRQIASAYAEGGMFGNGAPWPWNNRPPVVVLADKRKAQMDEAVHEMLRDRGLQLEVHTREGNPFKMSDLRKVAASKASTIIVLHPDSASNTSNAEAIKASVVMCLTALGPQEDNQRVVVQMAAQVPEDQGVIHSLGVTSRLVGRSAIQSFELPDTQLMHRLIAQTAAQPGILSCWLDMLALANNSAQFYCTELPAVLAGKPYVEVRRAFAHAVACGYRLPTGPAILNPDDSAIPPSGSKLILLGRGGAANLLASPNSQLFTTAATAACDRLQRERTYKSKARNILVANWPLASIPELMEGFSLFTPANSTITFTLPGEPPGAWPTRLGSCRFNFICTDHPTSVKVLLEAGIKTADAVVLGSGAAGGGELEADARILAAVLQVQDAVIASKRRDAPHLVAPIRRCATSKLASHYLSVLAAEQLKAVTVQPALGAMAATVPAPAVVANALGTQLAVAAGGGGGSAAATATNMIAAASNSSGAMGVQLPAAATTLHGHLVNPVGLLTALVGGGQSAQQQQMAATQPSCQQQSVPQAAVLFEPEFLVPTDVTSALMTQVVSEPAYSDIMKALLFSSDGMEMYLRNPASFNIPTGVPISFAEVEEVVRLTKQTALGYIRGHGSGSQASSNAAKQRSVKDLHGSSKHQQRERTAVLGPAASHMVTFGEADRIVVLAQDFNL
eukprot:GHRR01015040.1.p1 GENE.GHRR01015040.1~~GHRR01015040.1.p1  ORF type:complete len:1094 (+),score=407.36 GHRR01015040.1:691-3972(+)